MASCATCNKTILFGGTRRGTERFCSEACSTAGAGARLAAQIPASVVQQQVWQVHQGNCPRCGGRGPIDVHTSYRVWSALVVTQWSNRPNVCCRSCGTRARLVDAGFSLVLGWWGVPWGLIWTPVQAFRNVAGIFSSRNASVPSPELENIVRLQLAGRALAAQALAQPTGR
jgi:hypothetical protein